MLFFFFFQAEDGIRDVAVTGVQTCALPISHGFRVRRFQCRHPEGGAGHCAAAAGLERQGRPGDRKSTRLNSSHGYISYAVFCLKKKKTTPCPTQPPNSPVHLTSTLTSTIGL